MNVAYKYLYFLVFVGFSTAAKGNHCCLLATRQVLDYSFKLCRNTTAVDLNSSMRYCKEHVTQSSHVVTFPSRQIFDAIVWALQRKMVDEPIIYFVGFYQTKNVSNRFSPGTGEYFWVTHNSQRVTNQSSSYWQPFAKYINDYDANSHRERQIGSFLMTSDGQVLPGLTVVGGELPDEYSGDVVCMTKKEQDGGATEREETRPHSSLVVYAIAGTVGAVVLVVVVVLVMVVWFRKRRSQNEEINDQEMSDIQTESSGEQPS